MTTLVPITDSLLSVRDEEGAPTGVVVFAPVVEIGKHVIATGAMKAETGEKIYGVVIDGRMAEGHRSDKPLLPSSLEIRRDGDKGAVSFQGGHVANINFA